MKLALVFAFALALASCVDARPPTIDAGVDAETVDANPCPDDTEYVSRYPYAAGFDCVTPP